MSDGCLMACAMDVDDNDDGQARLFRGQETDWRGRPVTDGQWTPSADWPTEEKRLWTDDAAQKTEVSVGRKVRSPPASRPPVAPLPDRCLSKRSRRFLAGTGSPLGAACR